MRIARLLSLFLLIGGIAACATAEPESGAGPEFDAAQIAALNEANAYRRAMGISPLRLNRSLCAAATAHSSYLTRNRLFAHDEDPQLPGFTGLHPWDRVRAFGYRSNGLSEDVGGGDSPAHAVDGLFAAPYHRMPFMNPGVTDVGFGWAGDRPPGGILTVDIASEGQIDRFTVYPYNGQTDVPLSWGGGESPDPLRLHPTAKTPIGFPINFSAQGTLGVSHFTVERAELRTAAGTPVQFFLNSPDNDNALHNACVLLPEKPLAPGSDYTARIDFHLEDGRMLSRSWSFRTVTAPPAAQFRASLRTGNARSTSHRVSIYLRNTGPGAIEGFSLVFIDANGRRESQTLPRLDSGMERRGSLVTERRPVSIEMTPLYQGAEYPLGRQTVRLDGAPQSSKPTPRRR
jgi:hypothetical protein